MSLTSQKVIIFRRDTIENIIFSIKPGRCLVAGSKILDTKYYNKAPFKETIQVPFKFKSFTPFSSSQSSLSPFRPVFMTFFPFARRSSRARSNWQNLPLWHFSKNWCPISSRNNEKFESCSIQMSSSIIWSTRPYNSASQARLYVLVRIKKFRSNWRSTILKWNTSFLSVSSTYLVTSSYQFPADEATTVLVSWNPRGSPEWNIKEVF